MTGAERDELREQLRSQLYAENAVSEPARKLALDGKPLEAARELGYRAGWNDAIRSVRRLLQEVSVDDRGDHAHIPEPNATCRACGGSGVVRRIVPFADSACTVCDGRGVNS